MNSNVDDKMKSSDPCFVKKNKETKMVTFTDLISSINNNFGCYNVSSDRIIKEFEKILQSEKDLLNIIDFDKLVKMIVVKLNKQVENVLDKAAGCNLSFSVNNYLNLIQEKDLFYLGVLEIKIKEDCLLDRKIEVFPYSENNQTEDSSSDLIVFLISKDQILYLDFINTKQLKTGDIQFFNSSFVNKFSKMQECD